MEKITEKCGICRTEGTMQGTYQQIESFLEACGQLIDGKYNTADTGISGVLRAIAASPDLTGLFGAVTAGYNFAAAKRTYFRTPAQTGTLRGMAYAPSDRRELLAFVFCLFVEIDAGKIDLDGLLHEYFYRDGSYAASYDLFADRYVRPFRDIVADCFPDNGGKAREAARIAAFDDLLGRIAECIPAERARLKAYGRLRAAEVGASECIFAGIQGAVERKDALLVVSQIAGYKYLLAYTGAEDENSRKLFALAERLKKDMGYDFGGSV